MSNSTLLFSKADFMTIMDELIKENEFIVMSNTLVGSISLNNKLNRTSVSFAFAADAFNPPDVRGIADNNPLAFCICKKENLSEGSVKALAEKQTTPDDSKM